MRWFKPKTNLSALIVAQEQAPKFDLHTDLAGAVFLRVHFRDITLKEHLREPITENYIAQKASMLMDKLIGAMVR